MRNLIVNFPAWMIEDGSHKPFEVGQVRKLSIEVFPVTKKYEDPAAIPPRCQSLIHQEENRYRGCAKVWKDLDNKLSIFDFGSIQVIKKNWRYGYGFFNHEWAFHVDPYFAKNVEELKYDWTVTKITLDCSPLIVEDEDEIIRDKTRPDWLEVNTTDQKAQLPVIGDTHDIVHLPSHHRWLLYLTRKE